jgi:hypothetical protein
MESIVLAGQSEPTRSVYTQNLIHYFLIGG